MYKKILLGAAIFFVVFTIKTYKSGEPVTWSDSFYLLLIAVGFFAFKEWVDIPYDWDKHKNKGKDNKNLS